MLSLIMFGIAIPLALIFSYCWAVIIFRLFGTDSKKDKIIRVIIYIAVAFLVFGGWGVLMDICIFFWIRDFKKKTSYYHARHLLGKAAFGLSIPVFAFSAWQLEVPQRIIVNLLPVKLEIVNDDFEYNENPKQNFSAFIDSNLDFEYETVRKILNFAYTKNNIYACDDFDCKGDKKYVGYMWEPWSDASTLGCISISGSCNRYIKRNKRGRNYLMSFIENKKNKTIKRKNDE